MTLKRMRLEPGKGPRGFSRWIRPIMQSYMMSCCDCGLVHEMQFYAVKAVKFGKSGYWSGELLPRRRYRVMFRARRAERYTGRERAKNGLVAQSGKAL